MDFCAGAAPFPRQLPGSTRSWPPPTTRSPDVFEGGRRRASVSSTRRDHETDGIEGKRTISRRVDVMPDPHPDTFGRPDRPAPASHRGPLAALFHDAVNPRASDQEVGWYVERLPR